MTLNLLRAIVVVVCIGTCFSNTRPATSAPALPNPVLYLTGTESFSQGGKSYIRYNYDVFNKDAYPAEMFAASPNLPPCGKNTNASRTWVDFLIKAVSGFTVFALWENPRISTASGLL